MIKTQYPCGPYTKGYETGIDVNNGLIKLQEVENPYPKGTMDWNSFEDGFRDSYRTTQWKKKTK